MSDVLYGAAAIWFEQAVHAARQGHRATALGLLMSIDARSWRVLRGGDEPAPEVGPAAAIWFEDAVRAAELGNESRAEALWSQVDDASQWAIKARLEDLRITFPQLTA